MSIGNASGIKEYEGYGDGCYREDDLSVCCKKKFKIIGKCFKNGEECEKSGCCMKHVCNWRDFNSEYNKSHVFYLLPFYLNLSLIQSHLCY